MIIAKIRRRIIIRKPWFTFDSTTSTGLDTIPQYSNVHIIDYDTLGNPFFMSVIDITNLGGSISTIADLIAATAQWVEIGGDGDGVSPVKLHFLTQG